MSKMKQDSLDFSGGINSQVSYEYQMMAFLKTVFSSKNNVYVGYEIHDDFLVIDAIDDKYILHQSKSIDLNKKDAPGTKYINFKELAKYNFIALNYNNFIPYDLNLPESKMEKELVFDSNSGIKVMGGTANGKIDYKNLSSVKEFSLDNSLKKFIPSELINKVKILKTEKEVLSYLENENALNKISIKASPNYLPSWESNDVMNEIYNQSPLVKSMVDESNYQIDFAAMQLSTLKDGILKSAQNLNFEKSKNSKISSHDLLTRDEIYNAFYRRINNDIFLHKNAWEKSYKNNSNDLLSIYVRDNGGYDEKKLENWTNVTLSFQSFGDFTKELINGEMSHVMQEIYEINERYRDDDFSKTYVVNGEGQKKILEILDREYKRGNITIEYLIVLFIKGATHE